MSELLKQKWYLLGQPWTHSDGAGFAILAGNEDPHIGQIIADTQDYCDVRDDEVSRAIAAHIIKLHNDSLQPAVAQAVSDEMVTLYLEAHGTYCLLQENDSDSIDVEIDAHKACRAALEAALAQRKAE